MPELTDPQSLRERIIQESQKYLTSEPQEGEFTRMKYQEWTGLEREEARIVLQELVKDGTLTVRKGKANGSSCNVYKEN